MQFSLKELKQNSEYRDVGNFVNKMCLSQVIFVATFADIIKILTTIIKKGFKDSER